MRVIPPPTGFRCPAASLVLLHYDTCRPCAALHPGAAGFGIFPFPARCSDVLVNLLSTRREVSDDTERRTATGMERGRGRSEDQDEQSKSSRSCPFILIHSYTHVCVMKPHIDPHNHTLVCLAWPRYHTSHLAWPHFQLSRRAAWLLLQFNTPLPHAPTDRQHFSN